MNSEFFKSRDDDVEIVGRERERSGLGALLDQARVGHGSLVLIGGQAGIGKTTLVRDLEHRAIDRAMLVLSSYCYDLTATPPFSSWAQIARTSIQFDGLPAPPAALQDETALTQSHSQQALFAEIERFLTSVAEQHPLVLILEDLHWSDQESLEFLRWFGHQIARLRVLVAVTYRDDELTRHHALYGMLPVLARETPAQRVTLRPLDHDAVKTLISSQYRLPEVDEARLVDYLQERAGGNPFFLGELLRSLEEEGRIYRTGGEDWALADLDHLPVPPLVRQVIDGRLDRLGDDARQALEVASVIGQDVPLTLWSKVSRIQDSALTTVIQKAVDAHLLQDARDGVQLRFPHALVREALYEGLLLPRRRALHRQVAEELIANPGVAPDIIAFHLQAAGDPRAIEWFVRAATRAERVAWLTAAEHLKAALQLMRDHDVDLAERGWLIIRLVRLVRFAEHDLSRAYLEEALEYAREIGDPILMAYATFCRGEVRFYQGEGAAGTLDNEAGLAILHDLSTNDRQRLDELIGAGIIVSDIVLSATFAAALGHLGAADSALHAATQTITEAQARGTPIPAEAPWAIGLSKTLSGDPTSARQVFARAREQFRAAHDYSMAGAVAHMELIIAVLPYQTDNLEERRRIIAEGEHAWIRSRGAHGAFSPEIIRSPARVLEGEWKEARDQILATRSVPMTMSRKYILFSLLAQVAQAQGDTALAWRQVTDILPDGPATTPGNTHFIAGLNLLGTAASLTMDDRDLDGARAWLEAFDRWLDWSGALLGQADNRLLWARYHRVAGNHSTAVETASEALTIATEPRQPLAILWAHRLLGELHTAGGRWPAAKEHLHESLRIAEACQTPYEQALTLAALAELEHHTGMQTEALQHANNARAILTTLGAAPALERLDTLVATIENIDKPDMAYPAGLTAREVEVLRLVTTGLTNAEVAEQLFVSRRTIDQHLRSIYNKLGVSSRTAATRFAVQNGLA